jgi:flotillin
LFGYRVPDADEVMLVSGGKSKEEDHPFRIYRNAKFIIPGLRKVRFLSLAQRKAEVAEPCTTTQGLNVNVRASVYFKIPRDDASIYAAGERFLDDQRSDVAMESQVGGVFSGHLRAIVGEMTIEDIIRKRQTLADSVLGASKTEVANMGLQIDSFQITHMDDGNSGYIDALSAPYRAKVQQDAQIAQSAASQAAAEKEQESQRNQSAYQRETLVAKAQYQADVDTQAQKSAQAGPLAAAQAQAQVIEEQEKIAKRQAALRTAQLESEEIAPATAQARKRVIEAEAQAQVAEVQNKVAAENSRITALANADNTKVLADASAHKLEVEAAALAANDRVNVDLKLIEQLPQLVAAAASGLANANLTVFNGADGLNDVLTSTVSQAMSIYNTLRQGLEKAQDTADARNISELGTYTPANTGV